VFERLYSRQPWLSCRPVSARRCCLSRGKGLTLVALRAQRGVARRRFGSGSIARAGASLITSLTPVTRRSRQSLRGRHDL